jgi:hypothetical protein
MGRKGRESRLIAKESRTRFRARKESGGLSWNMRSGFNRDETCRIALQMLKTDEAVTTKPVWEICKMSIKFFGKFLSLDQKERR